MTKEESDEAALIRRDEGRSCGSAPEAVTVDQQGPIRR
jgi:hypothetical protein